MSLTLYASGSGALSFVHHRRECNKDGNYQVVADSKPVLKEECEYLIAKEGARNPNFLTDYWLLNINTQWQLVHKVQRVPNTTDLFKICCGGEWSVYRFKWCEGYPLLEGDKIKFINTNHFKLFRGVLNEDYETKHLSTKATIKYFLEHEQQINKALNTLSKKEGVPFITLQ